MMERYRLVDATERTRGHRIALLWSALRWNLRFLLSDQYEAKATTDRTDQHLGTHSYLHPLGVPIYIQSSTLIYQNVQYCLEHGFLWLC